MRRETRHAMPGRIRVSWQDRSGTPHFGFGQGMNISRSGMAIMVEEQIPLHSFVQFDVLKMKFKGAGSVRYARRRGLKQVIGLQFAGGLQWDPETRPLPRSR